MGVDLHVTIEVHGVDDEGEYRADVCEMDVGRFYHWRDLTPDLLRGHYRGTFTFAQLRKRRDAPIFDGKVKDTDLYRVMRALASKYGKRHVFARWVAD
jgi:hypothetical protein